MAKAKASGFQAYNHDMHVPQSVAAKYPKLQLIMENSPLLSLFDLYDEAAKRYKRRFLQSGVVALCIGIAALFGVLAEVGVVALGAHMPTWAVVAVEVAALLALLLFVVIRQRGLLPRYLDACYARERLRHLRFQLFLDGILVEQVAGGQVSADDAIAPYLGTFVYRSRNLPGVRASYHGAVPTPSRLMVKQRPYSNDDIALDVYAFLHEIRLEHQLQYTNRRLQRMPIDRPLSLKEHFEWSEAIGKWCLFASLAIPVLQLTAILINGGLVQESMSDVHITLSITAIAMIVASVGGHAYQRGMGVPEEIESYESYASHVESLEEQVHDALNTKDLDRLGRLAIDMELEAERELRRFLAIKSKATFLI